MDIHFDQLYGYEHSPFGFKNTNFFNGLESLYNYYAYENEVVPEIVKNLNEEKKIDIELKDKYTKLMENEPATVNGSGKFARYEGSGGRPVFQTFQPAQRFKFNRNRR